MRIQEQILVEVRLPAIQSVPTYRVQIGECGTNGYATLIERVSQYLDSYKQFDYSDAVSTER